MYWLNVLIQFLNKVSAIEILCMDFSHKTEKFDWGELVVGKEIRPGVSATTGFTPVSSHQVCIDTQPRFEARTLLINVLT